MRTCCWSAWTPGGAVLELGARETPRLTKHPIGCGKLPEGQLPAALIAEPWVPAQQVPGPAFARRVPGMDRLDPRGLDGQAGEIAGPIERVVPGAAGALEEGRT